MIAAIVLAAGESRRMGKPKMLLPWGSTTVLGTVLDVLHTAHIDEVLVVSGAQRADVERHAEAHGARVIFNEAYARNEMLASLQVGLRAMSARAEAALVCLGDQPQIQARSVEQVCNSFSVHKSKLIVPSFSMRRGHPWLIAHPFWTSLLELLPPLTPRDFLRAHASDIEYVVCDSPSILADLDTQADYVKAKPQ